MNICHLSGRMMRPAVVFGEGKILKFILVTEEGPRYGPGQRRTAYVPCVIFEPPKEMEQSLIAKSSPKIHWEMNGRIVRNSFDVASGERRYATEVVVDPASVGEVKGGRG